MKSTSIDWRQESCRAVIYVQTAFHDCPNGIESSSYRWNQSLSTESKKVVGQSSKFKRRFATARVAWRAVAINEISIKLLPVKTWYKKVIRSSNIKFNKGNCFKAVNFSWALSWFNKKWVSETAYALWFGLYAALHVCVILQDRLPASWLQGLTW